MFAFDSPYVFTRRVGGRGVKGVGGRGVGGLGCGGVGGPAVGIQTHYIIFFSHKEAWDPHIAIGHLKELFTNNQLPL